MNESCQRCVNRGVCESDLTMDEKHSVCHEAALVCNKFNKKVAYVEKDEIVIDDVSAFMREMEEVMAVLKQAAENAKIRVDVMSLSIGWYYLLIEFTKLWEQRKK